MVRFDICMHLKYSGLVLSSGLVDVQIQTSGLDWNWKKKKSASLFNTHINSSPKKKKKYCLSAHTYMTNVFMDVIKSLWSLDALSITHSVMKQYDWARTWSHQSDVSLSSRPLSSAVWKQQPLLRHVGCRQRQALAVLSWQHGTP